MLKGIRTEIEINRTINIKMDQIYTKYYPYYFEIKF